MLFNSGHIVDFSEGFQNYLPKLTHQVWAHAGTDQKSESDLRLQA